MSINRQLGSIDLTIQIVYILVVIRKRQPVWRFPFTSNLYNTSETFVI